MAIDFRQSLDRSLATRAPAQHFVRCLLASTTRDLGGRDDSAGALHRAAAGSSLLSQTVYALTGVVARRPADGAAAGDDRRHAEIYVRLGGDTFSVGLVAADGEGVGWEARRILRVDPPHASLHSPEHAVLPRSN